MRSFDDVIWMVDNIVVRSDPYGSSKPDKVRIAEKNDGAAAMIMATAPRDPASWRGRVCV